MCLDCAVETPWEDNQAHLRGGAFLSKLHICGMTLNEATAEACLSLHMYSVD